MICATFGFENSSLGTLKAYFVCFGWVNFVPILHFDAVLCRYYVSVQRDKEKISNNCSSDVGT